MPITGQTFTPRATPPTDVNAELQLTQAALNGNFPCPPPPNYPLPASVRSYLAVADVPTVNDAILYCTGVIGAASDPTTNGSTRYAIWGGHGYVETAVLDNYFLAGKPWPADQVIKDAVYGGQAAPAGPAGPGTPVPPLPPVPPVTPPASDFDARITALEGRVATLEAEVQGIRDALSATTGTPGGGA
jgi:hypothetical protein